MTDPNWTLSRKRETLAERARIIQTIRAFFIGRGYLEVETPQRIPGNAPEAHIDPVVSGDWVLQTSPELAMKRLLAAGYEELFQLSHVWREGERGQYHLPEFTLLEWYRARVDYHALMSECEELFFFLVPDGVFTWQGTTIDLTAPWERLTVAEVFDEFASVSLAEALESGRFEEVLCNEVEPHLGLKKPIILTEYPVELAALARPKPGRPDVAERFELYLAGLELANAFSELTDPIEQRRRFEQDESTRRAAGRRPTPMPDNFLNELEKMPDAAGIALGVDRLVMLLTDSTEIGQVVAFTMDDL